MRLPGAAEDASPGVTAVLWDRAEWRGGGGQGPPLGSGEPLPMGFEFVRRAHGT